MNSPLTLLLSLSLSLCCFILSLSCVSELFETDGTLLPNTKCDYRFDSYTSSNNGTPLNTLTPSSLSSSSQMSVFSSAPVSSTSSFTGTSSSNNRLLSSTATSSSRSNKGRFYSPQYPSTYPKGIKCSYTFTGLLNQRVRLVFEHIMLLKSDLRYLQYLLFLSLSSSPIVASFSHHSPMKGNSCTVKSLNHMSTTSLSSWRTNLISQVNFKVGADLLFSILIPLSHSILSFVFRLSPSLNLQLDDWLVEKYSFSRLFIPPFPLSPLSVLSVFCIFSWFFFLSSPLFSSPAFLLAHERTYVPRELLTRLE